MKKKLWWAISLAMAFTVAAIAIAGCDGQGANIQRLTGAGASSPYPLYSKWVEEYKDVEPNTLVDYMSIGSGGGIKGIIDNTIDFAGTDTPMTDEELSRVSGSVLHIPALIGAVAITYNLPDKPVLNLDGQAIADIFLGKIEKWNDPRLVALNPGISFPDSDIAVIHRSDGSGTTYVFSDYLSDISPSWKNGPGKGKSIEWPIGMGAKGNEGVAGQVAQVEGSIGYVELAYAVKNGLPSALIQNKAGKFIEPSTASATAAASAAAVNLPDDMRVSIVNAPGETSYPLATFSFLLVCQEQKNQAKGRALAQFLWWAVHEGQVYTTDLYFAPLPESITKALEPQIKQMTYQGTPLL